MKQVALDISLLSQFNLMDYSLLLCVQYNPQYIDLHPDDFTQVEYTKKNSNETKKHWTEKNPYTKSEECNEAH